MGDEVRTLPPAPGFSVRRVDARRFEAIVAPGDLPACQARQIVISLHDHDQPVLPGESSDHEIPATPGPHRLVIDLRRPDLLPAPDVAYATSYTRRELRSAAAVVLIKR
jgi:hypothetical protein